MHQSTMLCLRRIHRFAQKLKSIGLHDAREALWLFLLWDTLGRTFQGRVSAYPRRQRRTQSQVGNGLVVPLSGVRK